MFWKEKDTKIFLAELLCIAVLGMTAALLLVRMQENRMRDLLFEHDTAIRGYRDSAPRNRWPVRWGHGNRQGNRMRPA